jgi:hypothetical protein
VLERLEKHFTPVAGKALERFGFAYGELIANWAAIVGHELATVSAPERVRWPKGGEAGNGRGRGGMLVVAVEGGHAIDLQHDSVRIIERINAYYGYEAITGLKIHQTRVKKDLRPRPVTAAVPEKEAERLRARLETIADDRLRAALERLGQGVLAGKAAGGGTS